MRRGRLKPESDKRRAERLSGEKKPKSPRIRESKTPIGSSRVRKKKDKVPSIAVLDSLFSKYVRAKAGNECQFWGMRGLTCSQEMNNMHLKSRRFPSMRWHEANTVCGCVAHHRHYHDHPDHFYEDIEILFGPERWAEVQALWNAGIVPTRDEKREMAKKFRAYLREAA